MQVILGGYISLYEKTGQYQFYGEFLQPVGMGALQIAFEQMKEKLAAEGLFDPDFKRELPEHVNTIAVITSPTGAAVRDIIQIAKRRDPRVKIAVFPTLVQGEFAAEDIVKSLKLANDWGKADVIILGRGGGSMEDLWAFNDERVAREIFRSAIPVISAVGHEPDVTISDFVADLRAATPSNAAELVVPDQTDLRDRLLVLQTRLNQSVNRKISISRERLSSIQEKRVLQSPLNYLQDRRMILDYQYKRIMSAMQNQTAQKRQRFIGLTASLDAMSPLKVLARGYSVTKNVEGQILLRASDVCAGDRIKIVLHQGELDAVVENSAGGKK